MSDAQNQEQKEGIVVHPHFKEGEAPHTNFEGTQDLSLKEGAPGNGQPSSEGTSGDQTTSPVKTTPEQVGQQLDNSQQGASSLPSDQTGTAGTTASAPSSNSQSLATDGQAAQQPPVITGTTPPIVQGTVVSQTPSAVQPAPVPTPSPVPTPAPAPAPAAPAEKPNFIQTGISEVDQIVENLMKDCSLEAKLIVNAIKEYVVKMKPGRMVSLKDGTQAQVTFYTALRDAINGLETDFRPTMQAILALFHHHKDGAFKETHVFRFFEHMPLSAEHRNGFRKIVTLFKTTANPVTRQDLLRQIHFDNITQYGLTERGRTKLAAFFGK